MENGRKQIPTPSNSLQFFSSAQHFGSVPPRYKQMTPVYPSSPAIFASQLTNHLIKDEPDNEIIFMGLMGKKPEPAVSAISMDTSTADARVVLLDQKLAEQKRSIAWMEAKLTEHQESEKRKAKMENSMLVSNQYMTAESHDKDICDMETEDEVDGEKGPSEKSTPSRDAKKDIPEEDRRKHKPFENAALPKWKMLQQNHYTIKFKEQNFDNVCMCKIGRCLNLCVNWNTQIECSEECRNSGCENNFFSKKYYMDIEVFNAGLKGHGVRARELIRKGAFIMEYIGEVIGLEEVDKRLHRYQKQGITHNYMFEATTGVVIDSTRKGNITRFINHSCNPNAIAQNWIVQGRPAIGIFSMRKIEPGEEVTFNYNFITNGAPKKCHCGAENCKGFIGTRKCNNSGQLLGSPGCGNFSN